MSVERNLIYGEIEKERLNQDRKWGGPDHDDTHYWADFAEYIEERTYRIKNDEDYRGKGIRQQMLEVAALSVAAIESMDRRLSR